MSVNTNIIRVLRRNLKQSLRNRQLRESQDLINQLKIEDPLSLETRGLELEFLIARENWPDALALAAQLQRLYPESARIHFLSGRLKYRHKQYDAALHFFEESNRLHRHWITQRWLGKTYTQQGKFEHAESLLLSVLDNHIAVNLDLAWLYERSEQPFRALGHVQSYLEKHPDEPFAKQQETRLKAQTVHPETLSSEFELLLELDEEIPLGMLPAYLNYLLESGQTQSARDFLSKYRSRLDHNTGASLAWVCYKLQAFDLAMDLFIQALPDKIRDVKYLSALESAARRCNRVAELIPYYENEAAQEKTLYGRIKRLRKDSGNDCAP
ncbi:MAG: tetratricopeptide repeat protein [Methylococcaceae bacterium]|nr:tetratricopeptide repeat protein [Methylococcaceae bacterium]